jgi:hypothetical protein
MRTLQLCQCNLVTDGFGGKRDRQNQLFRATTSTIFGTNFPFKLRLIVDLNVSRCRELLIKCSGPQICSHSLGAMQLFGLTAVVAN